MKQSLMVGAAFLAGIAVVGGTYAFVGPEGGRGFNEMPGRGIERPLQGHDITMDERMETLPHMTDEQKVAMEERHEAMNAIHEKYADQVEQAVASNDFTAFQAVHKQVTAEMEEIVQQRHQAMFERMVEYYAEHGKLPEHRAMGPMPGMRKPAMHNMRHKRAGDCDTQEEIHD